MPLARAQWRTDNPAGFHLTPGQACDPDGADVLIGDIATDYRLAAAEIEPVIPPGPNRWVSRDDDTALCTARHLIENVFEKLRLRTSDRMPRIAHTWASSLGKTTTGSRQLGAM